VDDSLPSQLQKWLDHSIPHGCLMILAGSSTRMMNAAFLHRAAPLYGRAHKLLQVRPMDYPAFCRACNKNEAETEAFEQFACVGGIPKYWEFVEPRQDVIALAEALYFDFAPYMEQEPQRVLRDEGVTGLNAVAALEAVYGDAAAMRWVDDGQPITRAACERWVEVTRNNYRTRGYGMSALVERTTAQIVGFCGIVHPNNQATPEIKYALDREHWGRGLATEAVRGMLEYAARDLGLTRVIATTAPENEASHRVLLKSGLVDLETIREPDGSLTRVFVWTAGGPAEGGNPPSLH